MDYPKDIFVKDYFEIHDYYSKIYGVNRTIILMQVGSFHECYNTDTEGINLIELAHNLDIICTRKNNNLPLSKTNPRMVGFPVHVTYNFIDKLIDMNYTVVLIDQITEPPQPIRKVTNIFSPATYLNKKTLSQQYLLSIVVEKVKQANNMSLCIGMSCYDLSTGDGAYFETYSNTNDILIGLDDTVRFMEKYPPKEIIFEHNLLADDVIGTMNINDITNYLSIDIKTIYKTTITNQKKTSFQKQFLDTIYNTTNIIDILDLQFTNIARLSLVILLEYINSHQPILLNNIKTPKIYTTSKYLYLCNRANQQLDVFSKTKENKGLFEIINYTKTQPGKRYLHNQLSLPLTEIKDINKRYEIIDTLIKGGHYNKIILYLEDIDDLDKLIRKLQMNIITPTELNNLYISFYQISKLIEYLENNKLTKLFNIKNKNEIIEFINYINNKFCIDKLSKFSFNKTLEYTSFYKPSVYADIDNIESDIKTNINFMSNLVTTLENIMDDDLFKKDVKKTLITLKTNDRDGHYLLLTNKRCNHLRSKLDKMKQIKVGNISLEISELEFIQLPKSTNTKINCKKIHDISNNINSYNLLLVKKLKEYFKKDTLEILNFFGSQLHEYSIYIAFIDFINSGAICATTNHHTMPIIKQKDYAYFIGTEMRHPIIENIQTEYKYIPHNIELGPNTKQDGILLYGINSSGKSTLMKSIGLNIILAQIGYFVACKELVYSPYHNLMTRISGNDNMYKGQSSFMVEMMELMTILKRNNNHTLVIADEICRGTEEKSANIIVCYMLEKLANSKTSFITATHLHKVATLDSVISLSRVKALHLKLTYDNEGDKLIYSRHLSDGQGDTFYGLQVARYLMKDSHFNNRTTEILNEYDNFKVKKSHYNSNIYLTNCYICKSHKQLETHHIVWQKDFNDNGIHKNHYHIKKNDESNLIILCMKCHDMVDRDEIIINGWLNTSEGKQLDYTKKTFENEIKTKYTPDLIHYITSLKITTTDPRVARIKIKETFNKKISTQSIMKLWA
jgi:DNA mismatch repair protein MutS